MNFIKNSLYHIVMFGFGLLIVNGLSFAMLPFYTRVFVPSEYALITLVFTLLPFTRYCMSMEICQAAPIFSADDKTNSHRYISIGFWFTLCLNLICYAIVIAINAIFHFVQVSPWHLFSLASVLLADCLFYYTSNMLRWQLRPVLYNSIISITAIVEVLLTFSFILILKLGVFGVFYAWLLCRMMGLFVNLMVTRELYKLTFNFSILKAMLAFSVPLLLSNLAYNINRVVDRWLIVTVLGLSAVGIYGAGAALGGVVNFIMASVSAALSPIIYRNNENEEAPIQIVKLFYMVLILCMMVAMFFALFNNEILTLLVARPYYTELQHEPIVQLILLSAIFSGLYVFAPGIAIKKKTIYVIWFNIIGLVLNITLAFLLINRFGMSGVAFATFCSVLCNALLYMFVSQRFYHLPFKASHLSSMTLLFTLFYLTGVWLGVHSRPYQIDSLLFKIGFYLIFTAVVILWLWKVYKELTAMLQDNRFFNQYAMEH